ncbi:hypothetical protein [Rubrivirga sp.]|uniref:hypothetical protein n=1 Tax=Rubrivirga sp. TaxID=1885344 RepID=UPI003C75EEAD
MVTTLRRIEPMSLAKIYAVVTGALMLAFALPFGCGLLLFGSAIDGAGGPNAIGTGFGLILIFLYPLFGVIGGFVAGWLYAFVYNLVADRVGGVELEFDEDLGAGVML